MSVEFNRGAIKPVECIKEGWALIKDKYWLFLGIVFVGVLIAGVGPFGILLGPMMCGIFISLLKKMRGEAVTFDLLFKGFDNFSASAIAGILQTLPFLVLMFIAYIPFIYFYFSQIFSMRRGGRVDVDEVFFNALIYEIPLYLLMIVGSLVIHAMFLFTYPLIVEKNMKALEAIKLSIRAVMGNLGGVIGLMLLQMLLSFVGVLACFVGVYFTLPLYYAADAVAYRKVFPSQESFVDGPPPPPKNWE
jgi:hypothetical protein